MDNSTKRFDCSWNESFGNVWDATKPEKENMTTLEICDILNDLDNKVKSLEEEKKNIEIVFYKMTPSEFIEWKRSFEEEVLLSGKR